MTMPTAQYFTTDRELLIYVYDAFNRRDVDSILALMHPEVEWPNGMDGGWYTGARVFAPIGRANGAWLIPTSSRSRSKPKKAVASW